MSKIYSNLHEAYLGTLADVYDNPDYICEPRGQKIREKLDYKFVIENPISEVIVTKDLDRNKVIQSYTKKECELYDSGTNLVEDFGEASKFWLKLQNPDGTINSAYGHLIKYKKSHGNPIYELHNKIEQQTNTKAKADFLVDHCGEAMRTPYEWCLSALKEDKDTRQAIIRFSLPEHFYKGNKDFTCTMHASAIIRENKLNLSVVMRSNDLNKGLLYDLPWFISVMDSLVKDLKGSYPDLEKGSYTHMVHSAHVYEKDSKIIMKMLGRQ